MAVDRTEYEAFQRQQRKVSRTAWASVIVVSIACFFVVGRLWSYVAGFVLLVLLPLAAYEVLWRVLSRRLLRRFPGMTKADIIRTDYRR